MNMKAVVYTKYGSPDVLKLKEIAKPTPKDNEVLIRVNATPVNFGDILARKINQLSASEFHMPMLMLVFARFAIGFNRPKQTILGSEFAGEIEAVGSAVTRFKKGEQVFGFRSMRFGANAEYLCMAENGLLTLKPANMGYEEAATVPGGALTALSLLKKVNIQPGQKVLVNGASGGIGSYALQLAKHYGAEVTGVCGTPRLEFVKALGADQVIDYTKEDFTQNGETYDLIIDVLNKTSFARCKKSLEPEGILLYVSFKFKQLRQMWWTSRRGGKRVICALSSEKPEDLVLIKELVEAGKLKSFVDRCYPLERAAEAHRYVETGDKRGHVVLTVGQNHV